MDQRERMEYLITLYQKLKPEEKITSDTTIRNTPIWKLAQTDGGPYQRIKKWLEDKNAELTKDDDPFTQILTECISVMKERNQSYGESWRVMSVESMANLCEMKLNRVSKLGAQNAKTKDELIDTINYCVFSLIKLSEKV